MLGDNEANATVAVKDLAAARRFYEENLGLRPLDTSYDGVVTYRNGGSALVVYASQHAGTNRATGVTWNVGGDFDAIVQDLQLVADFLENLFESSDVGRGQEDASWTEPAGTPALPSAGRQPGQRNQAPRPVRA